MASDPHVQKQLIKLSRSLFSLSEYIYLLGIFVVT